MKLSGLMHSAANLGEQVLAAFEDALDVPIGGARRQKEWDRRHIEAVHLHKYVATDHISRGDYFAALMNLTAMEGEALSLRNPQAAQDYMVQTARLYMELLNKADFEFGQRVAVFAKVVEDLLLVIDMDAPNQKPLIPVVQSVLADYHAFLIDSGGEQLITAQNPQLPKNLISLERCFSLLNKRSDLEDQLDTLRK
jgi:hypothetical protein